MELLSTLMQVVIENAGAEKGTFILLNNGNLSIAAQCLSSQACNLQLTPATNSQEIPFTIVHYVERTSETIVVNDANTEKHFAADPYIIRQQPKSILCMPIIQQGQLISILYLENNQCTGAFTSDHLEILKLLCLQVAVSLENAKLYNQLKDYSRKLEAKVQEQAKQLQQEIQVRRNTEEMFLDTANKAKSEFLANMSHELRTPLTAILGLAEVLQDEVYGQLNEKQHKHMATITQSGKHLLDLINNILDLAKIEFGKIKLQLAPTSIRELCESSLLFVRQQAHQKQINLSLCIPPELQMIEVDERYMRQVLLNLLSNAVKFTPVGGHVRVEVEASANEVLQIRVLDTGIGIAAENISKLFQPFVQLESSFSRCYPGTGLGLALVKQIVELHGGSVSLESEVAQGSRFTVSLPWKSEMEECANGEKVLSSQQSL